MICLASVGEKPQVSTEVGAGSCGGYQDTAKAVALLISVDISAAVSQRLDWRLHACVVCLLRHVVCPHVHKGQKVTQVV